MKWGIFNPGFIAAFRTFDGKSTAKPPKGNKLAINNIQQNTIIIPLKQYFLSDFRF